MYKVGDRYTSDDGFEYEVVDVTLDIKDDGTTVTLVNARRVFN